MVSSRLLCFFASLGRGSGHGPTNQHLHTLAFRWKVWHYIFACVHLYQRCFIWAVSKWEQAKALCPGLCADQVVLGSVSSKDETFVCKRHAAHRVFGGRIERGWTKLRQTARGAAYSAQRCHSANSATPQTSPASRSLCQSSAAESRPPSTGQGNHSSAPASQPLWVSWEHLCPCCQTARATSYSKTSRGREPRGWSHEAAWRCWGWPPPIPPDPNQLRVRF